MSLEFSSVSHSLFHLSLAPSSLGSSHPVGLVTNVQTSHANVPEPPTADEQQTLSGAADVDDMDAMPFDCAHSQLPGVNIDDEDFEF